MKPIVIPGSNYRFESRRLAEYIDADFTDTLFKTFPDGESYVRVVDANKVRDRDVIIANTMFPNQNSSFVETLLIIDSIRRLGARRIVLFVPYLAYARQDKVFLEGEPVSIKVVLEAFRNAGSNYLITIDTHNPQALSYFGEGAYNVLVIDKLFENISGMVKNPIILAPDKGALHRARYLSEKYGFNSSYLEKRRDRVTGEVSYEAVDIDVTGRDVVIVDDIISTGGTIATASSILLEKGARRVYVLATHGLFIDNAIEKLRKSGIYKIVVANTVGFRVSDDIVSYVDVLENASQVIEEIIL
ncbi:MAG: ribose-phosphate pyrophosphokinase [Desulfurococcaceae archaeon]